VNTVEIAQNCGAPFSVIFAHEAAFTTTPSLANASFWVDVRQNISRQPA
jgi:hypothetical protein